MVAPQSTAPAQYSNKIPQNQYNNVHLLGDANSPTPRIAMKPQKEKFFMDQSGESSLRISSRRESQKSTYLRPPSSNVTTRSSNSISSHSREEPFRTRSQRRSVDSTYTGIDAMSGQSNIVSKMSKPRKRTSCSDVPVLDLAKLRRTSNVKSEPKFCRKCKNPMLRHSSTASEHQCRGRYSRYEDHNRIISTALQGCDNALLQQYDNAVTVSTWSVVQPLWYPSPVSCTQFPNIAGRYETIGGSPVFAITDYNKFNRTIYPMPLSSYTTTYMTRQ